jgi:hypothetical protein
VEFLLRENLILHTDVMMPVMNVILQIMESVTDLDLAPFYHHDRCTLHGFSHKGAIRKGASDY